MGWREWLGIKLRIEDLAALIAAEFRKQCGRELTYDPSEHCLRSDDGIVMNLTNMYLEYSHSPRSGRAALVEKYVGFAKVSGQSVPKLWELAAKSIYPVVRSRFDRELIRIHSQGKPLPPILEWPWIDDLVIRIAYDWGSHLSQVTEELANTWGQAPDAVRSRAMQNLAALPRPMWQSLGDGVHELITDTSYQESLLLVDKFVEQLAFKDSVACIPSNRGVLLACDARLPASVAAMIDKAARNLQEKPWPLTGTVLERLSDGVWHRHQSEGAAAVRACNLHRLSEAITYNEQKAALDEFHQKTKTDVFVAPYGLLERPQDEGALKSWCTWAQGIHSSLPKTDLVAFGRASEDGQVSPIVLPWDKVAALFGRYMQESDASPPRFVVREALSDADWAMLSSAGQS